MQKPEYQAFPREKKRGEGGARRGRPKAKHKSIHWLVFNIRILDIALIGQNTRH